MFCRCACHAATRCTATYLCPATKVLLCIRTEGQKQNVALSTTIAATVPTLQVGDTGFRHLRCKLLPTCSLCYWRWSRVSYEYNSLSDDFSARVQILLLLCVSKDRKVACVVVCFVYKRLQIKLILVSMKFGLKTSVTRNIQSNISILRNNVLDFIICINFQIDINKSFSYHFELFI